MIQHKTYYRSKSKDEQPKYSTQPKVTDKHPLTEKNGVTIDALNSEIQSSRNSWSNSPHQNKIKDLQVPLIFDEITTNKVKTVFYIHKYSPYCSEESKIDKIVCIQFDKNKNILYCFLCVLSLFSLYILTEIFPLLKVKLKYQTQTSITKCTHFIIYCKDQQIYIVRGDEVFLPILQHCNLNTYTHIPVNASKTKVFEFKLHKYTYDPTKSAFVGIQFVLNASCDIITRKLCMGLNEQEAQFQKIIYKYKNGNIHKKKSMINVMIEEIKNPFYLVQIFCIIFWLNYNYENYAILLLIMTLMTLLLTVYETKQNLNLLDKICKYCCEVVIYRQINGVRKGIKSSSDELLPGDIFELPKETMEMPCDALLISGSAIMNESLLTGESNPIFKSHIPSSNDPFNLKNDYKYILYSGTRILQSRTKAFGYVLGIGFDTEKGNLIRAILYKDTYQVDNKRIIRIIVFILLIGFISELLSIKSMIVNGYTLSYAIYKLFEMISIILPAGLPACIAIGVSICLLRLKNKGINCLVRSRINIVGNVNIICFDKTGTLTEDHVDVYGFILINYSKGSFVFDTFRDDISEVREKTFKFYKEKYTLSEGMTINPLNSSNQDRTKQLHMHYIECLACCNSLTNVQDTLIGDPIDLEMFNSTGWTIQENTSDELIPLALLRPKEEILFNHDQSSFEIKETKRNVLYEVSLIRRFDFVSKLQRMSVIVKNNSEDFYKAYCKGSPEMIMKLCKHETIPSNYTGLLSRYTNQGLRVLAMGFKMLKMDLARSQKISRESVEHEMIFLGLFIVANKLRPQTKRTMTILKDAGIKTIISTGDNVFTATTVAKECHIIGDDQFIYQCDVTPISDSTTYQLNCKELIVEPVDAVDDDESDEDSLLSSMFTPSMRKQSKFSYNMMIDDVEEDDLESESDGYDNDDIHLIIKPKPLSELKTLKFSEIKIKANSVFVITGSTFQILHKLNKRYYEEPNEENKVYHEFFEKILNTTLVFARMQPEHKVLLIECLKAEGNIIAMVGDGANDIGALRTANVGISLGLDETSISAHFISLSSEIKCIIRIICEGKTCLSNTTECYKYMILLSCIQFFSSFFLMRFDSYLSTNQCLLCDFFIVFPNAVLIANSQPIQTLTPDLPDPPSLNTLALSIISQIIIVLTFQYIAYYLLTTRAWYIPYTKTISLTIGYIEASFENTVIFEMSYLQCLITIIIFSIGTPFKREIMKNKLLLAYLIISVLFGYYLILVPNKTFDDIFQLLTFNDQNFRFELILISIINFLTSLYIEKEILPIVSNWIKTKFSLQETDKKSI